MKKILIYAFAIANIVLFMHAMEQPKEENIKAFEDAKINYLHAANTVDQESKMKIAAMLVFFKSSYNQTISPNCG